MDFYFTNIQSSYIVIPTPHTDNDDPLANQAAATNSLLLDVDPAQQGEVRLHSWHLFTSQAPVLDLTNKSETTTTEFLQVFHKLNLCTDSDKK